VWLTIGFFQADDTVRPVRLGTEIGKAENRQVRHRMFAIIDRTQMTAIPSTPAPTLTTTSGQPMTPGTAQILKAGSPTMALAPDSRTGRTWTLGAGSSLVLEPNLQTEETVFLQVDTAGTVTGTANSLYFTPTVAHPATSTFGIRGNPGPWTKYDHRLDPQVVPYYALID
jgi:hypothetical protein